MFDIALGLALALLQIADYRTTMALLAGGGRELNPLLMWLFGAIGVRPTLIVYKSAIAAGGAYLAYGGFTWLLLGLVALYAWVVWHNFNQLTNKY